MLFYTIIFRKKEIDFQNPSGRQGRAWQKKFVVTFSERMLYNSFQRISKFVYKIRHFAIMKKRNSEAKLQGVCKQGLLFLP